MNKIHSALVSLALLSVALASCTQYVDGIGGGGVEFTPARDTAVPTWTRTPTLFPVAIEATSTAQASTQKAINLANDQATRNAVASLQAAAIPATQTSIAATSVVVGITSDAQKLSATLAISNTQIANTAAAATRTEAPKSQDATRSAQTYANATATKTASDNANTKDMIDRGWGVFQAFCLLIITGVLSYSIYWRLVLLPSANSLEVRLIKSPYDDKEYPYAWHVDPMGHAHLEKIKLLNAPTLDNDANKARDEVAKLQKLKLDWGESIADLAQAASLIGSWSVSSLTKSGGEGLDVVSEDSLKDITDILIKAGYLVNPGGNAGTRWASKDGLIELGKAMESGAFKFDIPTREVKDENSPTLKRLEYKPAPQIRLSNATQRDEATLDDASKVVQKSKITKRKGATNE